MLKYADSLDIAAVIVVSGLVSTTLGLACLAISFFIRQHMSYVSIHPYLSSYVSIRHSGKHKIVAIKNFDFLVCFSSFEW